MNENQKVAVNKIIELLLALPWTERNDVWTHVHHNDVFCVYCGYGSTERPNAKCECENDE